MRRRTGVGENKAPYFMSRPSAIAALLASYPRSRPPLSLAQKSHYVEHYRKNRSSAIGAALERWMHRAVADARPGAVLLELGAGNLNHVPYEPGAAAYDVVEPFHQLWDDSPYRSAVRAIYEDMSQIEPDRLYDRIISVAVLEHLTDLPWIVAKSGLLLSRGERFQAGIPTEGGFLWGAAWRLTTGMGYRLRRGEDYGRLMRHEHVNTASEIQAVLEYFFRRVTLRRFPTPSFHLSFYTYLKAEAPDLDRCTDFCRRRPQATS